MRDNPADRRPPTADDIVRLGEEVLAELPAFVRSRIGDVPIVVQDFADDEVLAEMGIEDPFELSGLYVGDALPEMSVSDPSTVTPMVFLYRQPILDEWLERGDVTLGELIAHVLVHEVGHHFGLSDEAIDLLLDEG